jgi:hypothetical protein
MNGSEVYRVNEPEDLPTVCPRDGLTLEVAKGRPPDGSAVSHYRSCIRCTFVAVWHPPEPGETKAVPS